MKIVKVNVGQEPFVKEIDGSLKSMQREVGGLIEMMMLDNDVCIICNDEGKLIGLPLNRAIYSDDGRPIDIIAGDFFLCYAPPESEDFESIPDELIDEYIRRFNC